MERLFSNEWGPGAGGQGPGFAGGPVGQASTSAADVHVGLPPLKFAPETGPGGPAQTWRSAPLLYILLGSALFALAGCSLRGKPKIASSVSPPVTKPAVATPAPPVAPPPPLSAPQTTVKLPPEQPLNPEALLTVPEPAPPAPPRAPRRPPAAAQPKPEATAPAAQVPAEPPAQTAEPERPPVQTIVPADEQKRLQESAQAAKREVRQILSQMDHRRLSAHEKDTRDRIQSFVSQSDEAEKRGDMPQAAALAQRAQALARGWQSGR